MVSDGLTVDGNTNLTGDFSISDNIPKITLTDTDTSTLASITANSSNLTYDTVATSRDHTFKQGGTTRMVIDDAGIDVTGSVTAGDLIADTTRPEIFLKHEGTQLGGLRADALSKLELKTTASYPIFIQTNGTNVANFAVGGDVSFYNSTGTSQSLFWDASAESLGIGTSLPSHTISSRNDSAISYPLSLESATLGTVGNTVGMLFGFSGNTYQKGAIIFESLDSNARGKMHFALDDSAGSGNVQLSDAKMTIDYGGNVGIGTDNPAANSLTIEKSGTARLRLTESGVRAWDIEATSGDFRINNASGSSEAMRIDSSGNLLVGGSSAYAQGATTIANGGILYVSRSGGGPATFRRNSSDGSIITLEKDGTSVGSIGTGNSSRFHIGSGDVGLMFAPTEDTVYPWNSGSNAQRDGAIDLGFSSHRFKDLYLSGGAYLGGTGSANHLDDYEEGTFTPTLGGGTSFGTTTYTTQTGTYTKIGDTVHLRIYLDVSATTGSGFLKIGGIPFTVASLGSIGAFLPSGLNWGGGSYLQSYAAGGDGFLRIYYATDNANWQAQQITNETQQMLITIAYQVA